MSKAPKTPPEKWLDAAQKLLVAKGIDQVKVDAIAKRLGVSRGGFYYFYKDRAALLEGLLNHWRESNLYFLPGLLVTDRESARKAFDQSQIDLIEETRFDPAYDLAVRDWARKAPKVKHVVDAVDADRIGTFERIFRHFGYAEDEALIRARITYYHQIGYYVIGVKQTKAERFRYLLTYERALAGNAADFE